MSDVINVDYSTKIPNNVGLTEDRQVLRALESWHPGYIDWWKTMGPVGFQEALVYLRTAVSVDPKGWAKFDYVRMPEYRWGILLAPQGRTGKFRSVGGTTASRSGRRCRASTAPCCAASSSSRATPSRPRSSSSAISARRRPRSTTCATSSRSTSRRAGTCGRWSMSCRNISAATAARRPELLSAAPATPTSRACSAPSTRRRRTGSPSTCSPSSPTATARCSSRASRSPASIRSHAPAASCSPRKRTTCSSARPASAAPSSAPARR